MITRNGPGRLVGRCTSRSCSGRGPYATPATGGDTAVTLCTATSEPFAPAAATGDTKIATPVARSATIAPNAAEIVTLRLVVLLCARCSCMSCSSPSVRGSRAEHAAVDATRLRQLTQSCRDCDERDQQRRSVVPSASSDTDAPRLTAHASVDTCATG